MDQRASRVDISKIWDQVRAKLAEHGIDFDVAACCDADEVGARVRFVCVAPDLKNSVEELSRETRDQVVMVRVDTETSKTLDAWVDTGAVKSRSEAAALFISEGIKVRQAELDQLRDALRSVDEAKAKLHAKAREVLGDRG